MSLPHLTTASSLIRNLISSKGSDHLEASGAVEAASEVFVKSANRFMLIYQLLSNSYSQQTPSSLCAYHWDKRISLL
jgi:hypothetical protein